jgi:hypothetical protein
VSDPAIEVIDANTPALGFVAPLRRGEAFICAAWVTICAGWATRRPIPTRWHGLEVTVEH